MTQTSEFIIKNREDGETVFISEHFRVDHPFRITRQIFGPNVLDTEGTAHSLRKREWNSAFGRRNIQSDNYQKIIKDAMQQGFDYALSQGNLFLIAEYTPNKVILDLLNCGHVDPITHYKNINPLLVYLEKGIKPEGYMQARQYVREAFFYNNSELFARMPQKERENDLSLLVGSGVETTVVSMEILLSAWATDTARFRDAIHKLGVDEFITRLLDSDPPLGIATKYCSAATELAGTTINKGDIVHVSIKDTNRDSKCPMHYQGSEKGATPLTFGLGRHHCPGHLLAKAELNLLAEELLKRDINDFTVTQATADYQRPMSFRHPTPLIIAPSVK